jgi:uncharacterized ferredoxin-like protein
MMVAPLMAAAARAIDFIIAQVAMGIPVNLSGKSISFDRPPAAKH